MTRISIWVACLGIALALSAAAPRASAHTDVSIQLRIGDPYRGPRLVFEDEPDVVVVPGTRVYYVRDHDYDLYRYGNYWFYNYDGGWYRARRYDGPFMYVGYRSVPSAVASVPVRYRRHWRAYDEGPRYHRYKEERSSRGEERGEKRSSRGEEHERGRRHN